jgi:hypothetical protein
LTLIQQIHHNARNWADRTTPALQASVAGKGLVDTGALQRSIEARTYTNERIQEVRVGFRFLRYGVFVAKGARRGHGGTKGSTWRTASGALRRTASTSRGKLMQKQDWYNPIVRRELVKLKEQVGNMMVVEAKRAFIR